MVRSHLDAMEIGHTGRPPTGNEMAVVLVMTEKGRTELKIEKGGMSGLSAGASMGETDFVERSDFKAGYRVTLRGKPIRDGEVTARLTDPQGRRSLPS